MVLKPFLIHFSFHFTLNSILKLRFSRRLRVKPKLHLVTARWSTHTITKEVQCRDHKLSILWKSRKLPLVHDSFFELLNCLVFLVIVVIDVSNIAWSTILLNNPIICFICQAWDLLKSVDSKLGDFLSLHIHWWLRILFCILIWRP